MKKLNIFYLLLFFALASCKHETPEPEPPMRLEGTQWSTYVWDVALGQKLYRVMTFYGDGTASLDYMIDKKVMHTPGGAPYAYQYADGKITMQIIIDGKPYPLDYKGTYSKDKMVVLGDLYLRDK